MQRGPTVFSILVGPDRRAGRVFFPLFPRRAQRSRPTSDRVCGVEPVVGDLTAQFR
jgi:hypothetical protein